MVGIDIFSGKKYEDICPSTHNMDVPHVKREDYQLTDIDDGFLVLMSDGGDIREDLKIPDGDLGVQLRSEFDNGKDLLVSINELMSSLLDILTNDLSSLFSALSLNPVEKNVSLQLKQIPLPKNNYLSASEISRLSPFLYRRFYSRNSNFLIIFNNSHFFIIIYIKKLNVLLRVSKKKTNNHKKKKFKIINN